MNTVVDFHTHILPGVDDGSASLEESIGLLRMEKEQGISCVVATPHFYADTDTPDTFFERRDRSMQLLERELKKHRDLPQIKIGAEVHYFPELKIGAEVYFFKGISASDAISELTIDSGRCILIEMPVSPWTDSMYRELEDLYVKRGILPIVAHVDRYISRFHTYGIPKRLSELPVLVQANAEFFLQRSTASMAMRMLKKVGIHLLGSDCHNLKSRKPDLGEAVALIRKRLGDDCMNRINTYAQDVLAGK